jgi:penicillin-insensitive murein endopeptidase
MRHALFLGSIAGLLLAAAGALPVTGADKTGKPAAGAHKGHKSAAKDAKSDGDAADSKADKDADGKDAKDSKDAKGKKTAKKDNSPIAKTLFGAQKVASPLAARAVGWYSKGCLSGGVQLDATGPAWQTMRPSRNRAWGHPKLIALVKRLATESKEKDGWPGLLVGDISQPRGGPMSSGHASHQVGLDADIWFNPMPDHELSVREREDISAKTMLDSTRLKVDPKMFTDKQVALIKRAASYPDVERIFVNPAIKKALCERAGKDRAWLGKVRPMWGHDYHFHIRIGCTNSGCTAQPVPHGDDGCGKEVESWLKMVAKSLSKEEPKPGAKMGGGSSDQRMITMNQLPAECKTVLNSPGYIAVAPGTKLPTFRDAAAPPSAAEAAAAAQAAGAAGDASASPAQASSPQGSPAQAATVAPADAPKANSQETSKENTGAEDAALPAFRGIAPPADAAVSAAAPVPATRPTAPDAAAAGSAPADPAPVDPAPAADAAAPNSPKTGSAEANPAPGNANVSVKR